jgi:hypothetical protein
MTGVARSTPAGGALAIGRPVAIVVVISPILVIGLCVAVLCAAGLAKVSGR